MIKITDSEPRNLLKKQIESKRKLISENLPLIEDMQQIIEYLNQEYTHYSGHDGIYYISPHCSDNAFDIAYYDSPPHFLTGIVPTITFHIDNKSILLFLRDDNLKDMCIEIMLKHNGLNNLILCYTSDLDTSHDIKDMRL